MNFRSASFLVATVATVLLIGGGLVQAAPLTLTTDGQNNGFSLTLFATIDPGLTGAIGPFGTAVTADGHVLVSNFLNNTRYVFNDIDGQTTASALQTITPSGSFATAYATAGGLAYGSVNGQFVQFNSDGSVNHALTGVGFAPWFGMWGNPVNGHILATTAQGAIIDINPAANGGTGSATTVVTTGLGYDGVTVSPDGSVVYVELNGHVDGYNIGTGTKVYDSGHLAGGPDGIGVISSQTALDGQLIVNFNGNSINSGFVGLLNPATNALTVIADGGTRGDYVASDVTNGTLLLVYSDSIYRLSCGPNCSIGQPPPPPSTAPEPSGLLLAGPGLFGILFVGRSIRRKRA